MDFLGVAELCAPNVHVDTMHRIAAVESSFNPFAIGVVGGRLERQPKTLAEAVATAHALEAQGYNYSVGLVQVNRKNFGRYDLTLSSAFDVCKNLRAGGAILEDCFRRAPNRYRALTDAFSCYYSGSFSAGYKLGYVDKVTNAPPLPLADYQPALIPVVPSLARTGGATARASKTVSPVPNRATPASEQLFVSAPIATPPTTPKSSPATVPSTALLF